MTQPIVIEHAHSELGPSASDRWLNCPGSVLLTRGMPDPGSIFAAEGTAAHTVSDWCRVQQVPAFTFRGQVLKVDNFEFTVDDEMIAATDQFCEYVEALPGDAGYEERVHYEAFVPGGFGTLDDRRLSDNVCHVTDEKYGKGVQVFAKDNSQLKLYALGLYLKWNWLYDFDKVILTVHQARLNHIDVWETDMAAILVWAHDVARPIALQALQPGAPFKAGDWCQFCPAKATCKVRAQAVIDTAIGEFGNLGSPKVVALLTNDEIAKILPNLELVKKWCNDVESYALGELARGHAVGDWKVVEGRSNRSYSVPKEKVEEVLLPVLGEKIYTEPELKSVAQVETLLGGKKKAADVLALISHKPKGKPKLAPGSDPREPLVVDVGEEFEDLDAVDE